jgi:peroxiredoxin
MWYIKKRIALITLVALIAIPVIGFVYLNELWVMNPLKIGEIIPVVNVKTLEGKEVSIYSTLLGKSVLIFFSTDCLHCQKELYNISLLYPMLKDSLCYAAISLNEKQDTENFIRSQNIPFPVYLDCNGYAKKSFHVHFLPAVFIIDERHYIMQFNMGEQKRDQLWSILRRYAGFTKDSSAVRL